MLFYIDPGTGSMLFAILIGLFGAAFYSIKIFFVKIKSWIGGGKVEKVNRKIPFVIYSDDKRYWCIFESICNKLDKLDKEVLYLAASEDDPVFKKKFKNIKAECIGKGNKSFFRLNYLNASIVLSTTPGLGVYQWKRSKKVDYYVHIPHAASDIAMYRSFGIDYYDAILISGDFQGDDVRELEKLRNLPEKELYKIGIPYMDDMLKRVKKAKPIEDKKTTVLLAPSWGPSAILSVYGGEIIKELLNTGYHIVVRPHPQSFSAEKELMDKLMAEFPESENLEWNRDNDNFEVLRRSDILISDFSGVIFDFALIFEKPVIYTNPNFDTSPYDMWWLNRMPWTSSALPRIGRELTQESFKDIKKLVSNCLKDKNITKGLTDVKKEVWDYAGKGADRTVKYLTDKLEELESKQAQAKAKKEQEEQEKEEKKKEKKNKKVKKET